MYDNWDGHDWDWQAWLAMSLMMAVFAALLVLLVVLVVRAAVAPLPPTTPAPSAEHGDGPPAERHAAAPSPEHLLDKRFARGDIDEQEYVARRDLLRSRS